MNDYEGVEVILCFFVAMFIGVCGLIVGFNVGHKYGMYDLHNGEYECVTALDKVVCRIKDND